MENPVKMEFGGTIIFGNTQMLSKGLAPGPAHVVSIWIHMISQRFHTTQRLSLQWRLASFQTGIANYVYIIFLYGIYNIYQYIYIYQYMIYDITIRRKTWNQWWMVNLAFLGELVGWSSFLGTSYGLISKSLIESISNVHPSVTHTLVLAKKIFLVHPGKLTWHWKIPFFFNRKYIDSFMVSRFNPDPQFHLNCGNPNPKPPVSTAPWS